MQRKLGARSGEVSRRCRCGSIRACARVRALERRALRKQDGPGEDRQLVVCAKVDLCEIDAPKTDGESLKPLLDKVDAEWSHVAYSQVLRGQQLGTNAPKFKDQQQKEKGKGKSKKGGFMGRSVRNEQFRYTEWGEGGVNGVMLYDLVKDPTETTNLAADPAHAEIVKQMQALLKK